jgi:hypothetical protein
MANRILRDYTDSERVNNLSDKAETFYTRLMMKADDYGSFHANPKLLKAALYPLKTRMTEGDVIKRLSECIDAGLLLTYRVDDKDFLIIVNFGQRLRSMKRRFPPPPADICQQLAATRRNSRPEVETETEVETEDETETETKVKVRENVSLKPKEILTLQAEHSEVDLNWMYDKLSAYKLSKGKRYKSDYGAINVWVLDSLKKEKSSGKKENKTQSILNAYETVKRQDELSNH